MQVSGIEYRTQFWYRQVSKKRWYRPNCRLVPVAGHHSPDSQSGTPVLPEGAAPATSSSHCGSCLASAPLVPSRPTRGQRMHQRPPAKDCLTEHRTYSNYTRHKYRIIYTHIMYLSICIPMNPYLYSKGKHNCLSSIAKQNQIALKIVTKIISESSSTVRLIMHPLAPEWPKWPKWPQWPRWPHLGEVCRLRHVGCVIGDDCENSAELRSTGERRDISNDRD